MRARPMASICCSPPDRVPPRWPDALFKNWEHLEDACRVLIKIAGIGDRGTHLQIFQNRHPREYAPSLRRLGNAQTDNLVGGHLGNVFAVKGDMAGARPGRAADGHHQRGFSRAIGADESDDFALLHIKVDALERLDFSVEGLYAACGEEGFAHFRPPCLLWRGFFGSNLPGRYCP